MDFDKEQYDAIEETLDDLLKQEFITPEDIDMIVAKFKNNLLTIEKKEDFLPFMSKFMAKAEENDEYHEDRIDSLKTEIESFYDKIATNFSLYHVAGYKDPADNDISDKLSDNDNEDWNELLKNDFKQPIFGPNIPENKKSLVQNVLEKLSTLQEQKKLKRTQLLEKWRYLRLANHIRRLKHFSPALNIMSKYMIKRYGFFYKLRAFAKFGSCQGISNASDYIKKFQDQINQLREEKNNITQKLQNDSLQKKETEDLRRRLNEYELILGEKNKENQQLKSSLQQQSKLTSQKSIEESEKMKKINSLNQLIKSLQKRENNLERTKEEQEKKINQQQKEIQITKNNAETLREELTAMREKINSKNLSGFGKLRYFMKVMNFIKLKLKASGLMKIYRRKEKAKQTIQNVTDRIKARLLIQTRHLNCGQDLRKSFFKWMVKSNPDFIRELISKIAVTGKINTSVAFWRMKKLTFKPLVSKLPEAVKAIKRTNAIYMISQYFQSKERDYMKVFLRKINPNFKSLEDVKREKFLQKIRQGMIKKSGQALKTLRDKVRKEKRLMEIMESRYQKEALRCFQVLKRRNYENQRFDQMQKINRVLNKMNDNYKISGFRFFNKVRQRDYVVQKLVSKLIERLMGKQRKILSSLQDFSQKVKQEQIHQEMNQQRNQFKQTSFLKRLKSGNKQKMKECLRQLIQNKIKNNQKINENNAIKKGVFKKFLKFQKNSLKRCLDILRENKSTKRSQDQKIKKFFDQLKGSQSTLMRKYFNQLHGFAQEQKFKEGTKKMKLGQFFKNLKKRQQKLTDQSLRRLMEHNRDCQSVDKQKINIFNRLKDNLRQKLGHHFNQLKTHNFEEIQKDQKRLYQRKIIGKLRDQQNFKISKIFEKLKKNKNLERKKSLEKRKIMKKLMDNLTKKMNRKTAKAFGKLSQNLQDKKKRQNEKNSRVAEGCRKLQKIFGEKKRNLFTALKAQQESLMTSKRDQILYRLRDKLINQKKQTLKMLSKINKSQNENQNHQKTIQSKFFQKLKFNNKNRLYMILRKLQENRKNAENRENLEREKKDKFFRKINSNQENNMREILRRLIKNSREIGEEDKSKKDALKKLMGKIKKIHIKKQFIFNLLRDNNEKMKNENQKKIKFQRDFLIKLIGSQQIKMLLVLKSLVNTTKSQEYQNQLRNLQDQFEKNVEERKKKGALLLLVSSQQSKMKEMLYYLRKHTKDEYLKEKQKFNKIRGRVFKMMESQQLKKRRILNLLREHRKEQNRLIEEEQEQQNQKLRILGMDDKAILEINKFKKFFKTQTDLLAEPQVQNQNLDNLVEFMKNNNQDGRYDEILKKVKNGEISGVKDLMDYIEENNKNGQFDDLKEQVNNPNLDMDNIKRFIELNNHNGRFNDLIEEMKKNPHWNKIDLYNFLEKNNKDGKYNDIIDKINNGTELQKIKDFMKDNNKEGKFDKILEYLNTQSNPQMTDFVNFVQRNNKNGVFDDLINRINRDDKCAKSLKKLLNYAAQNNADGRYADLMKFVENLEKPKLSQLSDHLCSQDDKNSQILVDQLNKTKPSLASEILSQILKKNKNGKYDEFLQKIDQKNPQLGQLYKAIKNSNDKNIKKFMGYFKTTPKFRKYLNRLKNNNPNNINDQLLLAVKRRKISKLSDLIPLILKLGHKSTIKDLDEFMGEKGEVESLKDFLKRKNFKRKFDKILDTIEEEGINEISKIYPILEKDKSNRDVLMTKLDGFEEDQLSPQDKIKKILKDSQDVTFNKMYEKVNKLKNPTLEDIMATIEKHNKYKKFDKVYEEMDNEGKMESIENLRHFLKNNKNEEELSDLIKYLNETPKPLLTDLFSIIKKNNCRGKLKIAQDILNEEDKRDLMEDALEFIKNNNQNGQYNDLLEFLKNPKNRNLAALIDFIGKNNQNGELDDLKDVINQKKETEKFSNLLQQIKGMNSNKDFDELVKNLEKNKNPKISNIIDFINMNAGQKKYDDIKDLLTGTKLNKEKLLKKLKEINQNGLYDDIIDFIEKNPEKSMDEILQEIKRQNKDGKFDRLLDFIDQDGKGIDLLDEETDDLFKFMAIARQKGLHKELFDYLEKNNVSDPRQILDYLRRNNEGGRYQDLIDKFEKYIQDQDLQPINNSGKFNLISPFFGKMKQCLEILRSNVENQKNQEINKGKALKNLLETQENKKKDFLVKYLLKLMKINQDYNQKISIDKVKKKQILQQLIHSLKNKKNTSLKQLRENQKERKEREEDERLLLVKVINRMNNHHDKKLMKILDILKNNNIVFNNFMKKVSRKIVENQQGKLKQVLDQLRGNKELQRGVERDTKRFLNFLKQKKNNVKGEILRKLMNHNKQFKNQQREQNQLRKETLLKIINGLNGKKRTIYQRILQNSQASGKFVKEQILWRILRNQQSKSRQALNSIINNSKRSKQRERVKYQKLKDMMDLGGRKKLDTLRNAFGTLKSYQLSQLQKEQDNNRKIKQIMILNNAHYLAAQKRILDKLREFNKNSQNQEKKLIKSKKRFLKKFNQNAQESMKEAFKRLRDNQLQRSNQLVSMRQQQTKAIKRLISANNFKNSQILKKFQQNLQQCIRNDRQKNLSIKIMEMLIVPKIKNQLRLGFSGISSQNSQKKIKKYQRNLGMKFALEKMVKEMKYKKNHAFKSLVNNMIEDRRDKRKIKGMIGRVVVGQGQKLRETFEKLKQINELKKQKEKSENIKIKGLMNGLLKRILRKPFQKLVEHSLSENVKNLKKKGILEKINFVEKLRAFKSIGGLQKNFHSELLRDQLKGSVFAMIKERSQRKSLLAFNELVKCSRTQKESHIMALKVIRKNVMRDYYHFSRILKMNKFLYDRNILNSKLISMIFCIKKNHKIHLRKSLHIWNRTKLKNKVRKGTAILENLIQKRKNAGYDSIKTNYLYQKFEKFIKGLMKLVGIVERKLHSNREHFWDTLFVRNPWFLKVINIWTIFSNPNDQIAFWRMRYSKDLKEGGVSAEQTLYIKKLIYILEKRIQKNKANGYYLIQTHADQNANFERQSLMFSHFKK